MKKLFLLLATAFVCFACTNTKDVVTVTVSNPLAMEMAQCIIENAREELIQTYPNPLYEGETADPANQSAHPSTFAEPLTFELFQAHQELSERAKG